MSVPSRVVFDAEPMIAFADDELGAEVVERFLEAVGEGEADGAMNVVTASEVRYIIARAYGRDVADHFLAWVEQLGVELVAARPVWPLAADYIIESNPALGDAYALGKADHLDATLVVGADDDFDSITEVAIERFRDESV
jgi:predicted nucleic acid-binding protein